MTRLFVYSLPWTATSDALMEYLTSEHFAVESAQVIMDKETGQSKGFAFVEFTNEISAKAALQAFQDGKLHLGGRKLGANEAHPRPERPQSPSERPKPAARSKAPESFAPPHDELGRGKKKRSRRGDSKRDKDSEW
jgi:RNA recognition motif-containing protein